MLCKDVRNLLLDFCEGTLTDGQRTSLQSHLHTCLSCRKRHNALLVGLHAVKQTAAAQPVISDDSLEGVLAKIRALPPLTRRRRTAPLVVGSAFSAVAVASVWLTIVLMFSTTQPQMPKVSPPRVAQMNPAPQRVTTTPEKLRAQTPPPAPVSKTVVASQRPSPAQKKSKDEESSVVWTFHVESVAKTDSTAQPLQLLTLNPSRFIGTLDKSEQPFTLLTESSASTHSFVEVTDSAKGEIRRIETGQEVNEEGKIQHSFVAYTVEPTKSNGGESHEKSND